jgi:general stress protein 26
MADDSRAQDLAHLKKLLKGIQFAMLTTTDANGELHSRPMATQELDENGDLWFFTQKSSHKLDEVDHDRHVNVAYAEPSENRFVSVSGLAELVLDPAKNKELWNPLYKAWFPDGLDDAELALLKVHVNRAQYWDSPSSRMVQLAGFLKATLTGQQYRPGENKEVVLGGTPPSIH